MMEDSELAKLTKLIEGDHQNPEDWKALAERLAENGQRRTALKAYQHSLEMTGGQQQALAVMKALESLPIVKNEIPEAEKMIHADLGPLAGVSIPVWFQVFLGLFSFLIMLMTAMAQKWTATDLVWSLWISSLALGYSFMITTILAMFFGGKELSTVGAVTSKIGESFPGGAQVLHVGGALFMLAFFSFHFLFFHFVHSVFLNQFFPLVRSDVLGGISGRYFISLIAVCVRRFWAFIFISALSQTRMYVRAFQQIGASSFFMPYKNVVKMHISIFIFAFLHMAGVPSVALYFVMIIYFFPLRGLWEFVQGTLRNVDGATR